MFPFLVNFVLQLKNLCLLCLKQVINILNLHSISILIFLLKLFVFIAIGLFPDVGSSAWLPHLTPGVGEYIGLTGVRLGPGDLLHTGIATHYITSNKIPQLEQLIEKELTTTNADEARKVLQQILKHLHEAALCLC